MQDIVCIAIFLYLYSLKALKPRNIKVLDKHFNPSFIKSLKFKAGNKSYKHAIKN